MLLNAEGAVESEKTIETPTMDSFPKKVPSEFTRRQSFHWNFLVGNSLLLSLSKKSCRGVCGSSRIRRQSAVFLLFAFRRQAAAFLKLVALQVVCPVCMTMMSVMCFCFLAGSFVCFVVFHLVERIRNDTETSSSSSQ
jgi:hypothetical protein